MAEGRSHGYRPLAQSPEDLRALHQLCRDGRLYDVERWIAEGKPLQVASEAIRKGTRPKTALQIALESGQHSLASLLLRSGYLSFAKIFIHSVDDRRCSRDRLRNVEETVDRRGGQPSGRSSRH